MPHDKFNSPPLDRDEVEDEQLGDEEQPYDEEESIDQFELDCVEESNGDDLEETDEDQSVDGQELGSRSAPHSPANNEEEEAVALHVGEEEECDAKQAGGPRTPPEGDVHAAKIEPNESSDERESRQRRSSTSRSRYSERSPPRSNGKRRREPNEEEEHTHRKAKVIRLREAGSSYAAPRESQPYFKNPSYYPGDKQSSSRGVAPSQPPPLAKRVAPLPGGRLPLVQQRRASPASFAPATRRRLSPPPPKRRRAIVEDVSHVPLIRSPPSYRSGASSNRLGSQTLYPSSRRGPYPVTQRTAAPARASSGDWRRDDRSNGHHSSTSSRRRDDGYIVAGDKVIPKPFVPPPPVGKKWNCPKRETSPVRKWNCPKREYSPGPQTKKWNCPKREVSPGPPKKWNCPKRESSPETHKSAQKWNCPKREAATPPAAE